jgi:hypothetical protein
MGGRNAGQAAKRNRYKMRGLDATDARDPVRVNEAFPALAARGSTDTIAPGERRPPFPVLSPDGVVS